MACIAAEVLMTESVIRMKLLHMLFRIIWQIHHLMAVKYSWIIQAHYDTCE